MTAATATRASEGATAANEARVLVFAPFGVDADLTRDLLASAGIASVVCGSAQALAREVSKGAAALIVTEEALVPEAEGPLLEALGAQPPWSDLPVIVSVSERDYTAGFLATLSARANVIALERPVRVRALVNTVQSALRARRRQYETRDLLIGMERLTRDLRVLEEEMRTVVENLPELAWTANPDGGIAFYNRRWYDYTGTTFDEVAGWGWEKVHEPSWLPRVIERWRFSLTTGVPFEMEYPLRRADGAFRWFLTRVTPLRDREGNVVRWIGMNVDIDDQRRAAEERELVSQQVALLAQASERLSRSLDVEESLHGLGSALLEGFATSVVIDLVDDRGALGLPAVMVDKDPAMELRCWKLRREHPPGPGSLLAETLETKRARVVRAGPALDAQVKEGSEARLSSFKELGLKSAILAPLIARGATLGVLSVSTRDRFYQADDLALVGQLATRAAMAVDNARLYAAARKDRERTGRLQALAAGFSAARTMSEVAEHALTEGCEAARAPRGLLGILADGDTVLDLVLMRGFPPATVAAWRRLPIGAAAPLTLAVRTGAPAFYGSPEEVTDAFPHLAGRRSEGDQALAVLPLTVGGRTFGVMGFVYDEPRIFSEGERRQMFALARLCAQATDRASLFELAQRERRHAEEANRAKDEFLAMVSHELRTPLNAMLGWTRLLRTGTLDEVQRARALETIERNALAQTQLIEDLLDVTRIITGKLRLTTAPLSLAKVIEAAIETATPAARAKGVALEASFDEGAGMIGGDVDRLQQVVWNLLANAVKFTPRGGSVRVRLRASESAVEIAVDDTGAGIPAEFLPHIFERFRQADGGTTRSYGGLGLGLAIVKHIVELHGGTVEASSAGAGRGSSFVVRIPTGAARSQPPSALQSPERLAASDTQAGLDAPPALEGLRVLVVEDDPDARELLVALLEQHGVMVVAASNTAEGMIEVERFRPDVILSDIGMPVEDGHAFVQRVRALPRERGGRTPAVALTAYARTEDRRKALLAGFTMHVAKPIDPAELLVVLANVAGRIAPLAERP